MERKGGRVMVVGGGMSVGRIGGGGSGRWGWRRHVVAGACVFGEVCGVGVGGGV